MSVQIKTPTKTEFDHPQPPFRDRKGSVGKRQGGSGAHAGRSQSAGNNHGRGHKHGGAESRNHSLPAPGRIGGRKRRFSEKGPGEGHGGHPFKKRYGRYGRHERIVLPTKFLLGGNINDPLNLNSLCDEEISKALNQKTPVSSPLPLPPHKGGEVKVLIPPNIRDPLGLDSEFNPNLISPKFEKKRKHKRKNSAKLAISPIILPDDTKNRDVKDKPSGSKDISRPMHINISSNISTKSGIDAQKKVFDKIVSPVIPQISPKKRKRRSSECVSSDGAGAARNLIKDGSGSTEKIVKSDKTSPHRPKYRKQSSAASSTGTTTSNKQQQQQQNQRRGSNKKPRPKESFVYGNYNRYYGYRNPDHMDDPRLKPMKREWFENLEVLDIGCNVGNVTLALARDFKPKSIVGMDIDPKLIGAARKNIRHFLSKDFAKKESGKFPVSMEACFGPLVGPAIRETSDDSLFPNNVAFVTVSLSFHFHYCCYNKLLKLKLKSLIST